MGATQSGSTTPIKYYQLKAKVDETNSPYFVLQEKVDGKWQATQKFDTMSGLLASAEIKEKEFKGTKKNVFILGFEDANEISKVEMTHNGITHSVINALASNTNILSTYSIQVWKKAAANNKYYGQASVKIDGEKLAWSIDPTTAPRKEPVMVNGVQFVQNGVPVYDDSKQLAFYETMFNEKVVAKLASLKSSPKEAVIAKSADATNTNPITTDTGLDSLPF